MTQPKKNINLGFRVTKARRKELVDIANEHGTKVQRMLEKGLDLLLPMMKANQSTEANPPLEQPGDLVYNPDTPHGDHPRIAATDKEIAAALKRADRTLDKAAGITKVPRTDSSGVGHRKTKGK